MGVSIEKFKALLSPIWKGWGQIENSLDNYFGNNKYILSIYIYMYNFWFKEYLWGIQLFPMTLYITYRHIKSCTFTEILHYLLLNLLLNCYTNFLDSKNFLKFSICHIPMMTTRSVSPTIQSRTRWLIVSVIPRNISSLYCKTRRKNLACCYKNC